MRSLITKVALLASTFAIPAVAHADQFTFTTQTSAVTFYLPTSPVNLMSSQSYFSISDVTYFINGASAGTADVFFNASGAFAYRDTNSGLFPFGAPTTDGVMYFGSTSTPTFQPGTYQLNYDLAFGSTEGTPATLVIVPTPEPSALLLMGTGLLGTFAAGRRRFLA